MNSIGRLISPFLERLGIEESVRLEGIRKEWSNIFGSPLSLHMWPSSLKNGELLISVDSPVWLQQISFYKDEIIKKLNPSGVKDVRFRLGKTGYSQKVTVQRKRPTANSLSASTLQYIEDTVSEINDGEIKDSIRKAMEKSFSFHSFNAK
ncbi:MAG: hypothetical protein OHK0032_19050 [Thermodesulfovibrionales bacterium]